MKAKDGDTDKEAQVERGSLVSLSFQLRNSLCRCLNFLFSHCRCTWSYSCHHYTLHCSPPCAHTSACVAWPHMACPAWGTCNVFVLHEYGLSVGRLVGRSVDARVPVDHASVGLAQACPNYMQV